MLNLYEEMLIMENKNGDRYYLSKLGLFFIILSVTIQDPISFRGVAAQEKQLRFDMTFGV